MSVLLYEVERFPWLDFIGVPLLMVLFILAFPHILIRVYPHYMTYRGWDESINEAVFARVIKRVSLVGLFIAVTYLAIFSAIAVYTYQHSLFAYKNGDYEVAEGYVQYYAVTENSRGTDIESFAVNGVSFSYTAETPSFGYHTPQYHGGVIRGEGQHVRIAYTYCDHRNIILRIEEIS